jgi:nucleoside-diphosphate-sugar epimerase
MKSSFLITGAQGFVGAALADALSPKYPVTKISRICNNNKSSNCLTLDQILEADDGEQIVRAIAPSCIIHCAALAHRSPPRTPDELSNLDEVNINLSVRLAHLAKRTGIRRYVFISSIGVHGSSSNSSHPVCEDSLISPANPYALSKSIAEHKLRGCLEGSSCELSIIRPALVYGPGMRGNLRLLIRGIDVGLPFPLARIRNRRSFLYLGNLISAIEAVALHPQAAGESFVVSDEETISTPDLISSIARVRNRPCRILHMPASVLKVFGHLPFFRRKIGQLVDDLVVDSSKIRRQLGWRQPFKQMDAIEEAFSLSANLPV